MASLKKNPNPSPKQLIILSGQVQKHRAHWRRVNNTLIIHHPLRWGTQGKGGDVWETEQSKLRNSPSYTGSEINYLIQAQSGDLINVPADGIKWLPEFFFLFFSDMIRKECFGHFALTQKQTNFPVMA